MTGAPLFDCRAEPGEVAPGGNAVAELAGLVEAARKALEAERERTSER